MKKHLKKLLVLCLILGVFCACSKKEDEKKTDVKQTEKKEEKKSTAKKVSKETVFVDANYVKDVLDGKVKDVKNFVIAEVSWGEVDKSPDYLKNHIKGAIHINTDTVEKEPVWNLRSPEELEKSLLNYGIDKDTTVILYGQNTGCARVATAYLYAGVENVKILNGGLKSWTDKNYPVEKEETKPTPVKEFKTKVPAHPEYITSIETVKEKLGKDNNFQLISIRSENEWLGKESGYTYIPRAGEPKGALWGKAGHDKDSMDFYINSDGKYKDFSEIKKMWEEQGISTDKQMSFYCGTGWRGSVAFLLAHENGLNASLYDGGWNQWQMDDKLPVQIGDPKSKDVEYKKVGDLSKDKASKDPACKE